MNSDKPDESPELECESTEAEQETPTVFEGMKHIVEIPEGALAMSVVEIVSYLDPDGTTKYAFRWNDGGSNGSNMLGLCDIAKANLLRLMGQ